MGAAFWSMLAGLSAIKAKGEGLRGWGFQTGNGLFELRRYLGRNFARPDI
jgi:hypothetical protein